MTPKVAAFPIVSPVNDWAERRDRERHAVVRALHEHGLRAGRAGDEEEERQMAKLERRLLNWGRS